MLADGFQALLTFDKNLQHQQNFEKYTLTVFVLNAPINQYKVLTTLSGKVKAFLDVGDVPTGPIIIRQD